MKTAYMVLALVGLVVPYYFFGSFLMEYGLDWKEFVGLLFANPVSSFFAVDLIICGVVFLIFSNREVRRLQLRAWWPFVLATLMVGPSFAFPLFLFCRRNYLEAAERGNRKGAGG